MCEKEGGCDEVSRSDEYLENEERQRQHRKWEVLRI